MGKNTPISLGDHFEKSINLNIKSGKYNSVSEVIRSVLRLLEREVLKEKALVKALKAGEASGFGEAFDPKQHLIYLRRKREHKQT